MKDSILHGLRAPSVRSCLSFRRIVNFEQSIFHFEKRFLTYENCALLKAKLCRFRIVLIKLFLLIHPISPK